MAVYTRVFCAALLLLIASGCHPQARVKAAPTSATPSPPPPPPPPPPPKCEALSESCVATESTTLRIGTQGASIQPPVGWIYAKEGQRSIAVSVEKKSVLSAVELTSATPSAILDSLEQQTLAAGIEKVRFGALKKRLKKPQITVQAGTTPVTLWEVSKSTSNRVSPELREQGLGTLLVFVAQFSPDRVVCGLGFVVVPDAETDAAKVMHAVQTLKASP